MYQAAILTTCLLFGHFYAYAQDCPDPAYRDLVENAEKAVSKGEYDMALRLYNAAKVSCPNAARTVDQAILGVFNRIQGERDRAVEAEQKAKNAQKEAECYAQEITRKTDSLKTAYHDLQIAKERTDSMSQIAREEKAKAERLQKLEFAQKLALKSLQIKDDQEQKIISRMLLAWRAFNIVVKLERPVNTDIFNALFSSIGKLYEIRAENFDLIEEGEGAIKCIQPGNDGNTLYITGSAGGLSRWTIESWKTLGRPTVQKKYLIKPLSPDTLTSLDPKENNVHNTIALSEKGKWLALGGKLPHLILIDLSNDKDRKYLDLHNGREIYHACFYQDHQLITCGADSTLRIFDLRNQKQRILLTGLVARTFHINGKDLFVGTQEGSIHRVDLHDFQETVLRPVNADRTAISSIAIARSAKDYQSYLACGYQNGRIQLFGIKADVLEEVDIPQIHQAPISGIVFDHDLNHFFSGSLDGSVGIWDLERLLSVDGKEVYMPYMITDLTSWVTALAFSNTSNQIIVGGKNGVLRFWTIDPHAYAEVICERINELPVSSDFWKVFEEIWEQVDGPPIGLESFCGQNQ